MEGSGGEGGVINGGRPTEKSPTVCIERMRGVRYPTLPFPVSSGEKRRAREQGPHLRAK